MSALLASSFVLPTTPPRLSVLAVRAALGLLAASNLGLAGAQEADRLEPVVITGSTREQKLVDTPYAINAVGSEALRAAGPMVNLSEALQSVPGLVVANRNNYAQDLQISSRGFGARAGFGVRGMRLYADGIPATMPDGQGQVAHFDLAGADRVEVLRGPFSSIYGSSSGGVIAVFSKPVREPNMEVAADAGSAGLRQLRASVATPFGDGFDLSANVSDFQIDGFRPQSDADRQLATVRLGWKNATDKVVATFSHQRQRASDPLGLDAAQFNTDPDSTTANAILYNTRKTIEQDQLGTSWQHRFDDAGALAGSQLSAYAGQRAVVQFLAITPGTQANPRHGGGVIDFDRSYSGIDGRLDWRWDQVDLITGINLEQQSDDRRGFENFTGTAPNQVVGVLSNPRRNEVNKAQSREAYAQSAWDLSNDWQLSGGLRGGKVTMSVDDAYLSNGDDSGERSFSYVNPVIGLRWKTSDTMTLHASAGRGYETPTLGELAYPPNNTLNGFNTTLQAQSSRQLELGAKWRAGPLALDATVFAIRTANEIGVSFNQGGRSSFQNVGRTERSGAELSGAWRITPALRSMLAVSVLDATYLDNFVTCTAIPCNATTGTDVVPAGNRIAGTQQQSIYAELAWKAPWASDAETALEWRAAGNTAANDLNTAYAAGYGIANVRYRQRFALDANGAVELLARVDNLGDRRYAGSVIVNDLNGRYYEPAPGRSALVSLRYQRKF
ncbi:iron complex outermembrane receptor protein [Sphaerotilus mobilis]|uniref:Iron complex outermembrane receptor protein n=1 Tax=Sphaerotilus mobilis TaxID=47994 RepID=A0A4Q7LRN4_9BURK|nr:iron complex outermembrane receptor protein [Sphaerotilus mobilis]